MTKFIGGSVNVRVDDTYIVMLHEYIMIILTCVRYDQVVQLLVMTMYSSERVQYRNSEIAMF